MLFTDSSRGRPFAKDPAVVCFRGRLLLYYSIPPYLEDRAGDGWRIGIACGTDLDTWEKIGEISPLSPCDKNGLCAPGAIVIGGRVHLFYQTYGNGKEDAICHAASDDGVHFVPNRTNPVFRSSGDWNCGRAIDADVIAYKDRLLLFFATRDPAFAVQMTGVASAPLLSSYERSDWEQLGLGPILRPELAWEGSCIEAPAACEHDGNLYLFYGGGYNCFPQQVGCAMSEDVLNWRRISQFPILANGSSGEWNSCESGHPFIYQDSSGEDHLFYQGSDDTGQTWRLSRRQILWKDGIPFAAEGKDG